MSDFPLPDYDLLGLKELRERVRALGCDEVSEVLAHERANAGRTPVLRVLIGWLDLLEAGASPVPRPEPA
ncbi:hypothetical protein KCV87_01410 [Actinosynnema pretiosum subsp. pretiosum]|uniref:DUF8129 domain-containing protein n=2 Tax=Actinosynnema TaxID=40566 RepID=C6WD45_ACTMD|nr:hypothetical protein [Actinosynnema mirum]ACU37664.1 hypothetical protein Amir_3783 [Actinosynnema mirum DSM 43827]AXX31092.1 hypothetical protein APASM_3727 [Actinosynnema pretiosum subsp. pretiosum]QUF04825.1 hypothetical protein KCV87_01410 [Actinosynnema pretiosum subsp. pretiosum]